jgi:uncharacterized protein (TIGR02452 family)
MDLVEVWEETKKHYADMPEQESIVIHDIPIQQLQRIPKRFSETSIDFVKGDCVDEAIRLKTEEGCNPLLLNMADWFYAGGCVDVGEVTQEEELFRRSNYFKHLHQKYYPLKKFTTIYSKGVEFSRLGPKEGYAWMPDAEHLLIDCIAAPALNNHPTTPDHEYFLHAKDADTMKKKIQILFHVAAKQRNDSLVFSAWGCGAFNCPVKHVAQLFREVIQENGGVVKHVSFAVLGRNFEKFMEYFML